MSTGQEFVIGEGCLHIPLIFSAYLLWKEVYPGFPSWGSGVPCYLEQRDFGLPRQGSAPSCSLQALDEFFFFFFSPMFSLNTEQVI